MRFPRELRLGAAEVAVGRGLLEDRAAQLQRLDDAARRHLEVLAHQLDHLRLLDLARAERVDVDRDRLGDADRVRELHFALRRRCPTATMFLAM